MPPAIIPKTPNKRQLFAALRSQLDVEHASFLSHWRDLNDYILPRRGRFYVSDVNKGDRRNTKIIDSTATLAARTLKSGMMAGMTSPAREWKELITQDPDLNKWGPAKAWLSTVNQSMSRMFLRSGLYNSLPIVYGDEGVFATAAMMVEEDFNGRVMRTTPFAVGSYRAGTDETGKVCVFLREFQMTVRQIINKFGRRRANGEPDWSNISDTVKAKWDAGNYEHWIEVCHIIMPNTAYRPDRILARDKRYLSYYYETGNMGGSSQGNYIRSLEENRFLRESGYDYFPVLLARWEVADGDVYGTDCPGMTCLGDIKGLQAGEKRIARADEKKLNPPMVAPAHLSNATTKLSILPGDVSYVDEREGMKGFRAAHEVNFDTSHAEEKQMQTRSRIKRAFFEDVFLMLLSDERSERATATEIAAKKQEQLVALGPALEQQNMDVLDPLIDIAFDLMTRQNMIPPPPRELAGVPRAARYISIMAQAQKTLGLGGIERFLGVVGGILNTTKSVQVLDKVDLDKTVDEVGEACGVPAGMVRSDDDAEVIREEREKAQQAAQAAEQIKVGAETAKSLSQARTDQPSALSELMQAAQAGQVTP